MIGYGIINPLQVKHLAQAVCEVLGGGDAAVRLLCETAAAETRCGTAPDKTRKGAGMGLFQCDEIGFKDVVARAKRADIEALEKAFDFHLPDIDFRSLAYSPLIAAAVCRLFYKLKPEAIPLSLGARAAYWKKYYNTSLGKGTVDHYIECAHAFEVYF